MIFFHSTNGQAPAVNLRDALLVGQAPDRGLYLPKEFPRLAPDEIAAFSRQPYHEIAFHILSRYTEGIVDSGALAAICSDAYDFEVQGNVVSAGMKLAGWKREGPTKSWPMSYQCSAIHQGKWSRAALAMCKDFGIEVTSNREIEKE